MSLVCLAALRRLTAIELEEDTINANTRLNKNIYQSFSMIKVKRVRFSNVFSKFLHGV